MKVAIACLTFTALTATALLSGTSAIARETLRLESNRQPVPQFPARRQTTSPQTTVPHATEISPQIPPRPDMCVPDYSWFDYDAWEWVCVGHL